MKDYNWCLYNNLKLEAMAEDVTLSENATTAPTATAYANVALERTLKPAIWNTFSLPFSLSAEQIAASPLQGATIYAYESSDANSIRFTSATEIEAGKPYLLKPIS